MASPQHHAQIDGLRAVAVTAVMLTHWFLGHPALLGIAWGTHGVGLFFVISGYLITTILLDARDEGEASASGRRGVLAAFYARRALRILPAYYGLLLVLALAGNDRFWDQPWVYVLHVSNWASFTQNQWPGEMAHFWSLALEEQFYLVWPLAVLGLPRRFLPNVVVAGITLSGVSTLALEQANRLVIIPPAAFWGLLIGAGLALVLRSRPERLADAPRMAALPLLVWIVVDLANRAAPSAIGATLATGLSYVAFAAVVAGAVARFDGRLGTVLENRAVQRVGKISYGMYLYHQFFHPVADAAPGMLRLPILFACTWLAAEISFRVVEQPVNRHKDRFPYLRSTDGARWTRHRAVNETAPGI